MKLKRVLAILLVSVITVCLCACGGDSGQGGGTGAVEFSNAERDAKIKAEPNEITFITIGYDGKDLCILDPSYRENKYEIEPHQGKIRVEYPFTYCDPQVIVDDTQNRETPFYLFSRKKP